MPHLLWLKKNKKKSTLKRNKKVVTKLHLIRKTTQLSLMPRRKTVRNIKRSMLPKKLSQMWM